MIVNGVAALRCWPVSVVLGGKGFLLPAMPAISWIVPIVDQDWLSIIPGMLVSDESVDDMLSNESICVDDCVRATWDAISVASGMPWWTAVKLVMSMSESADLSGELALRGVDAASVSLGAVLHAVYRLLVKDADAKQRRRVDRELDRPFPIVGKKSERRYDPGVAAELFDRMARSRGMSRP